MVRGLRVQVMILACNVQVAVEAKHQHAVRDSVTNIGTNQARRSSMALAAQRAMPANGSLLEPNGDSRKLLLADGSNRCTRAVEFGFSQRQLRAPSKRPPRSASPQ